MHISRLTIPLCSLFYPYTNSILSDFTSLGHSSVCDGESRPFCLVPNFRGATITALLLIMMCFNLQMPLITLRKFLFLVCWVFIT